MKRLIAGALALALLTITAAAVHADVVAGHVGPLLFRDHRAATVNPKDDTGVPGWTDSLVTCGNGTGLVDTTLAWYPKDMFNTFGGFASAGADTAIRIKVYLTQDPASANVADLNAATITLQGTADGFTWGTVVAATGVSNWQADPQKSGSATLLLPVSTAGGWDGYRFIVTGISNTTGCFKLYVNYPQVKD